MESLKLFISQDPLLEFFPFVGEEEALQLNYREAIRRTDMVRDAAQIIKIDDELMEVDGKFSEEIHKLRVKKNKCFCDRIKILQYQR